jgi:hypothetical protein
MTGGDGQMPPHGNHERTSIRFLDPVDPNAPPPDGSRLLQTVLATPRPNNLRRRGARLPRLIPVGLALAFVAGVAAVAMSVSGDEGGGDEQQATSGFGGAAIIHYVVRESLGSRDGSRVPVVTSENWRLEDGSRARTISHWEGAGPLRGTTSENVLTSTLSLAYRPASQGQPARIIRYRASDDFGAIPEDPPPFGAPPIGGSAAVGDPRTVPDRLAAGDKDVAQLADATVRGIAVKQFEVGHCGESTSTGRERDLQAAIPVPQRAIVALARDTLTPLRVTERPCSSDTREPSSTRILDYLSFEDVTATPENLKVLELSPHPGVRVVDGIEIDKAEERDGAARTPTPTPTAPRAGG